MDILIRNLPIKILVELQDYINWEQLLSENFQDRIFPEAELLKIKKDNLTLEIIGKTLGFTPSFFVEYTGFNYTEFISTENKIKINGLKIEDPTEALLYIKSIKPYIEEIEWELLAKYGKFINQTQIGNFIAFLNKNFSNKSGLESFFIFDSQRSKNIKECLVLENKFLSEEIKKTPEIVKILDSIRK